MCIMDDFSVQFSPPTGASLTTNPSHTVGTADPAGGASLRRRLLLKLHVLAMISVTPSGLVDHAGPCHDHRKYRSPLRREWDEHLLKGLARRG